MDYLDLVIVEQAVEDVTCGHSKPSLVERGEDDGLRLVLKWEFLPNCRFLNSLGPDSMRSMRLWILSLVITYFG